VPVHWPFVVCSERNSKKNTLEKWKIASRGVWSRLINMVIEDEQNGTKCLKKTTEVKNRTLEDNIELLKQMITQYANSDNVATINVKGQSVISNTDQSIAKFVTYCIKECVFNSP
jgi:hypothetical protein